MLLINKKYGKIKTFFQNHQRKCVRTSITTPQRSISSNVFRQLKCEVPKVSQSACDGSDGANYVRQRGGLDCQDVSKS